MLASFQLVFVDWNVLIMGDLGQTFTSDSRTEFLPSEFLCYRDEVSRAPVTESDRHHSPTEGGHLAAVVTERGLSPSGFDMTGFVIWAFQYKFPRHVNHTTYDFAATSCIKISSALISTFEC